VVLSCPRCAVALGLHGATDTVTAQVCPRCDGVWIDGAELMTVCRTLGHLPERRSEVAMLGRPGAGIPKCPRCDAVPYEFEVLGELIDFCIRCTGAWIDGDETESLGVDLGARGPKRPGGYRTAADDTPLVREIACATCKKLTGISSAFVTLAGLSCGECHAAAVVTEGDRRANERDDTDSRRARDVAGTLEDADRERLRRLRAPTFLEIVARLLREIVARFGGS
jgi:Zn-finger nucleic acid-binding protein